MQPVQEISYSFQHISPVDMVRIWVTWFFKTIQQSWWLRMSLVRTRAGGVFFRERCFQKSTKLGYPWECTTRTITIIACLVRDTFYLQIIYWYWLFLGGRPKHTQTILSDMINLLTSSSSRTAFWIWTIIENRTSPQCQNPEVIAGLKRFWMASKIMILGCFWNLMIVTFPMIT